jgi:hypothetical protein
MSAKKQETERDEEPSQGVQLLLLNGSYMENILSWVMGIRGTREKIV